VNLAGAAHVGGNLRVNGQISVAADNGWSLGGIRFLDGLGNPSAFFGQFTDSRLGLRLPVTGEELVTVNGAGNAELTKFEDTGDVEILIAGRGIILKSLDGTRIRISVSNAGVVSVTSV
jgi:hypothetical protein